MTRNLKVLGVALSAVFAISAAIASSAQAEFTSGSDSTTLTAKALNNQRFIAEGVELNCTEVSFDNTTMGTVQSEILAEPTYTGCTITVGGSTLEAKVHFKFKEKCHIQYTPKPSYTLHWECELSGIIQFTFKVLGTFRECINIHGGTPTSAGVDYINGTAANGKMDVTILSTVTGITYEKIGLCKGGVNEANNMTYSGEITVTGDNASGEAVDVTAN